MLALSFERLCLALQRQNPQMLKQDLKPDEDEYDATHDGGGFFVARAKGVADRYAGNGEEKGRDANERHRRNDIDRERGKRDTHGERVNRGGDGKD